jgi:hypothetical protein
LADVADSDQIIVDRLDFPAYFYVLTLNFDLTHPVLILLQDLVTPSHLRQTVRQNLLPHCLFASVIAATMLATTVITIMIMITTASITKAMLAFAHSSFPNCYLLELHLLQVACLCLMHSYLSMLMN